MALIRIPVLIVLLIASGPLQSRYAPTRYLFTLDGAISSLRPWLALMAVAVAFLLAAGSRRDRRHATPVLVLEGLLALLIVIVPPLVWSQLGSSLGAKLWAGAMGASSGEAFAQMLALVWLLIVVRTGLQQRRAT
jgi:hypothetical protein